jgi:hypothetical protein
MCAAGIRNTRASADARSADLRRRPQRQLSFAVDRADRGVLLDRQVRVALEEEHVLEHVVSAGDRLVHIAERVRLQAVDVPLLAVVVDARLGHGERFLGRGNRREQLVLHVDQVERLGRGLLVPGDHRCDRVADIAHRARRKGMLVLRDRQDAERDRESPCR